MSIECSVEIVNSHLLYKVLLSQLNILKMDWGLRTSKVDLSLHWNIYGFVKFISWGFWIIGWAIKSNIDKQKIRRNSFFASLSILQYILAALVNIFSRRNNQASVQA